MRFILRVLADCLLAFFTAVWVSGIGSRTPRFLEVSVIGGTYAYPEGCFGISEFAYCLWGLYFIRVNHRLY